MAIMNRISQLESKHGISTHSFKFSTQFSRCQSEEATLDKRIGRVEISMLAWLRKRNGTQYRQLPFVRKLQKTPTHALTKRVEIVTIELVNFTGENAENRELLRLLPSNCQKVEHISEITSIQIENESTISSAKHYLYLSSPSPHVTLSSTSISPPHNQSPLSITI